MVQHDSRDRFKRSHRCGDTIMGRVSRHAIYGFYVDLGPGIEGLVDIISVRDDPPINSTLDSPPVGQEIRAVVLGYDERQMKVGLSTRTSDFARDWATRS